VERGLAVKIGAGCGVLGGALLLLVSVQAQLLQPRQSLHGQVRPAVASGRAQRLGDLPATQRLNVSIELAPRNQAALSDLLTRLYDPHSPDYRHYLSVAQFAEQFSPTAEDYQATVDWATAHGLTVTKTFANRLVVPVNGTVAQIEGAFQVKMGLYQHPTEARSFYSTDREPSLDLAVPVAHIGGLDDYSIPKPQVMRSAATQGAAATPATGSGPGGSYLWSDMRAAYYGGTKLTGAGQTVGLVEFDGYNVSDVNLTFSNVGQSYTVPVSNVLLDGATGAACQFNPAAQCSDTEQVLDIDQAIGMAPGLSQVIVYIGSLDTDVLNAIASMDQAQEVSISWTWFPENPSTDEVFFEEMAAQGQSVFVASGDEGAIDPPFENFYPAEDAWVTAVGGTQLTTVNGAWNYEAAWVQSGGGISPDMVPLPSWQAATANSENGASWQFRNVPDVAMEGNTDNYVCNLGVCSNTWGGTSFGAPRWAAFTALVNQQAATAGDCLAGFLNPALYGLGQGPAYLKDFHDITTGNNDFLTSTGVPYFNAVSGYDLVTGWGSPNGQSLIDALAPPPPPGFALSTSPRSLAISPGANGKTTITVSDIGAFAGNVTLAVSGLPSGVTASFGTNPSSASSALTLTVAASTPRGSYLLTITGTSGYLTAATSLALQVSGAGIALSPETAVVYLFQGSSVSNPIGISTYGNVPGQIALAVTSQLPEGVTASWVNNPTAIGTPVLKLTAEATAPSIVRTTVTVTGYAGGLTTSTTFALVVQQPLFLMGLSPFPAYIAQGSTLSSELTVIPYSPAFTYPVNFLAIGMPPGVTATFNPVTSTTGTTMTETASTSAPLQTTEGVSINGTVTDVEIGGGIGFSETVTNQAAFNLAASPLSVNLVQGKSASVALTIEPLLGFTGQVTFAIAAGQVLPEGVQADFSPNPTIDSTTLTVTASGSAPPAEPTCCWVTGTNGAVQAWEWISVFVDPAPSFTLSATAAGVSVNPGGSVSDTITVTPESGFGSAAATLSVVSPLPSGVTASFGTNPTSNSSPLTLHTSTSAVPESYPVTIMGVVNGSTVESSSATIDFTINGPVATSTLALLSPGGVLQGGQRMCSRHQ
jgi:subtilase family serine protease